MTKQNDWIGEFCKWTQSDDYSFGLVIDKIKEILTQQKEAIEKEWREKIEKLIKDKISYVDLEELKQLLK